MSGRPDVLHPPETWEWFGLVAHLCVGQWCRFHLATKVGPWIVSTAGKYVPLSSTGSERTEREWLAKNPNGEQIGCDRYYETMVFPAGPPCDADGCNCGMPMPSDYSERDFRGYQTAAEAHAGHLAMCQKWAVTP